MSDDRKRPAGWKNSLETYPGFLNVVLFETSRTLEVAGLSQQRVAEFQESRAKDRRIKWLESVPQPDKAPKAPGPPEESRTQRESHFYVPRTFITSGTFDTASIFLSPEMEMASWAQRDPLRVSGQDVNVCMLPTPKDIRPKGAGDVNGDFFRSFSSDDGAAAEPPFCSIIKLKVNPALWPAPKKNIWHEKGRLREICRAIWEELDGWRAGHTIDGWSPLCCVGITFGWNEFLVVALDHAIGPLINLSGRLRTLYLEIEAKSRLNRNVPLELLEGRQAHVFMTTISVIGHDFAVRRDANEELRKLQAKNDRRKTKRRKRIRAGDLLALADKIAGQPGERHDRRAGPKVVCQVGTLVYPGHEREVLDLFEELAVALRDRWLASSPEAAEGGSSDTEGDLTEAEGGSIDTGKRDVWSPELKIDAEHLTSLQAAALLELLRLWLRRGGYGTQEIPSGLPSGESEQQEIPLIFDTYTRIACPRSEAKRVGTAKMKDGDKRHVRYVPEDLFMTADLLRALDLDQEEPSDRTFLKRMRRSMAWLQVPYFLSEQILNLVDTFFWAHDRTVLWDESVELIPVVLALAANLRGQEQWWKEGHPEATIPWDTHYERELWSRYYEQIDNELEKYLKEELPGLLGVFRSYFYSRHLSSYLTDEMADMNLRFRGSLHQLLSITNLTLDAMADMVMGPRASMAVIGDKPSPEVISPCHVIVVHLSSLTFTNPLMLESLAHEIGHQFLLEVIRDGRETDWRRHEWIESRFQTEERDRRFESLQNAVADFDHVVFQSQLDREEFGPETDDAASFVESAADYIELLLLGYDLPQWVQSFMLKTVLSSTPVKAPYAQPDRPSVPWSGEEGIAHALIRAVLVYMAKALAAKEKPPDIDEFLSELLADDDLYSGLEGLRLLVRSRCTLGPSERLVTEVETPKDWRAFLDQRVFARMRWLAGQQGLDKAHAVYRAIQKHMSWDPEVEGNDFASRFLPCIRSAFADLHEARFGPFQPGEAGMLPALFLRHWMGEDELKKARIHEVFDPQERPWDADLQPAETLLRRDLEIARRKPQEPLEPVEAKVTIFQRGRVLTRNADLRDQWNEATKTFFLRMIQMVPAWRLSVLRKSEAVVRHAKH